MSSSSSYSSLDALPSSRRTAVLSSVDLESQHGSPSSSSGSSSSSSSSSVGLARRMSPKLPPLSHPSASSFSSPALSLNGSRHSSAVGGVSHQYQPLPHHSTPSSLAAHSSPPAASAASKRSVRFLVALLLVLGCVALLAVGWNHSALTRTPTAVCFDGLTCVTAQRQQHTTPTTTAAAAITPTPTTTATTSPTPTPLPSPTGPPFHDSLASLLACPPLASILAANFLQSSDDSGRAVAISLHQPPLKTLVAEYEDRLNQRLSAQQLSFDDWRDSAGRVSMAQYYALHAGVDLVSASTRNTNYTISSWSNVCITFGGDKDPHLVLLGSDVAAQQQLIDTQLLKPDHHQFSWVPPRWCNDQGRISAQAKANDDWLWIAADEGTAAFHQFEVSRTQQEEIGGWLLWPSARFAYLLRCVVCCLFVVSGTSMSAISFTSKCGRCMLPPSRALLSFSAVHPSLVR